MNKLNKIVLIVSSVLFANGQTMAATSEVNWINVDKFQDIRAGDQHKGKFEQRTFAAFEQHFAKLAAKLPADQVLTISVTNIDLAGDVNHGGRNRYRLMQDIYFPKMKFSYQLLDSNKQKISSGQANIKDPNFLMQPSLKYRNTFLGYEFHMLDKWFYKSFVKPKQQQS